MFSTKQTERNTSKILPNYAYIEKEFYSYGYI